jgi:hypothetical protein
MGTENQRDDDHDKDCHDHDKDCHDRDDDCKKRHHDCKKHCKKCDRRDDCDKDREHHKSHHVHELEKTIKSLLDSLAELGRGAHLHELLRIVHRFECASSAELAFVVAILDHLSVEVRTLERLQVDLVEASRKVSKDKDKDCD